MFGKTFMKWCCYWTCWNLLLFGATCDWVFVTILRTLLEFFSNNPHNSVPIEEQMSSRRADLWLLESFPPCSSLNTPTIIQPIQMFPLLRNPSWLSQGRLVAPISVLLRPLRYLHDSSDIFVCSLCVNLCCFSLVCSSKVGHVMFISVPSVLYVLLGIMFIVENHSWQVRD